MISLDDEISNWRHEYFQKNNKFVILQWVGYVNSNDFFKNIPTEINVINMAYATITKTGLSFDSLTRFIPENTLKANTKTIQKQNVKVILSITDHQDHTWFNMDPIIFIYNILDVLDEWGFDGIDIQCNSEIIGSNEENKYEIALESLITNLRKYIKNDKLITFTTFSSAKYNKYIIKNTSKYIDWVNFIIDDNNNNIQPLIDNILDNRYSLNVNNDKNIATYVWGIKNVI